MKGIKEIASIKSFLSFTFHRITMMMLDKSKFSLREVLVVLTAVKKIGAPENVDRTKRVFKV